MLKLRKVELLGFKSFFEKTPITFSGSGITCIVGPNGCGKSNVVDAISWVLGEQSHKMLRAERMADCIFNGTAKRPPQGMAEVTLTLVDPELSEAVAKVIDGEPEEGTVLESGAGLESGGIQALPDVPFLRGCAWANFEIATPEDNGNVHHKAPKKRGHKAPVTLRPGEIVVARRLYRSGQSEYLINGRVARLRDIQEIFMGIGLGPDSYAIIEQGRIGQILNSKPMDRRAIIEEAAGITMYKTKRRLSEAKLGCLEAQSLSRQRYFCGGGEAAGFSEAAGIEGSPIRGTARADARAPPRDAGQQGGALGYRGGAAANAASRHGRRGRAGVGDGAWP